MEPDFAGYATKANLVCSDGRTITAEAFAGQDKTRVPLVWSHAHKDAKSVLGHAILEARDDGMYAYAFFNDTDAGQHARKAVQHGDINMLSIWANGLMQKGKTVLHGAIREVSLVLAGANPGAVIESVNLRHEDGDYEGLDDEAIIYTGLTFAHSADAESEDELDDDDDLEHEDDEDDPTIQEVYESMTDDQKQVVHYMIGSALESADVTEKDLKQSNLEDGGNADNDETNSEGTDEMKHNIFENQDGDTNTGRVLSHDDMEEIQALAKRTGSMKAAVEDFGFKHGIDDIEVLFPDATKISDVPEWIKRRTEWVSDLLASTRKSPFSRIRTLQADLTHEDARAKGYVKGNLKREEFFNVLGRSTTPTTVYKKQALDRDDILDITDFDVVVWLKAEMRLMLDEEIARAILIGDGRDISHDDKINEQNIRPIVSDHELYTTQVYVNIEDANSSMTEVVDAMIMHRHKFKGTGVPNFYTTEYWIARFLTLRDADGHRMYKSLDELATELRVAKVIPVEVMGDVPSVIGIMVNPVDYVLGADKGGQVSMFDDFDIDYNKNKYLIETRLSGCLVKVKSAMVFNSTAGANVLVHPAAPTFNSTTNEVTIVDTTGVIYTDGDGTVITAAGSPYAVPVDGVYLVDATPAAGYYFETSDDDSWMFSYQA